MSQTPLVPLETQLACVRREIELRERCYPKWAGNNLTKQRNYARELDHMRAVERTLIWLGDHRETIRAAVEGPGT